MADNTKTVTLGPANLDEILKQELKPDEKDGNFYCEIADYSVDGSVRPPVVTKTGVAQVVLNDETIGMFRTQLKKNRIEHLKEIEKINTALAKVDQMEQKLRQAEKAVAESTPVAPPAE